MADSDARDLPDLTAGIPLSAASLMTRRSRAKSATTTWCWRESGDRSSRSARAARTTTVRSPTDWSSATRFAARCITPASASNGRGAARAGARSDRLLARGATRRHGLRPREGCAGADAAGRLDVSTPPPSSSSAAAPRASRRPTCCGARATTDRHHDQRRSDPPVDRPNLSKDYLAGEAQDDWIPLWPPELYAERKIDLLLGSPVASIDSAARTVPPRGRIARELRRAAARDRRGSRATADSRRDERPDSLPALVRRQPRDRRARAGRPSTSWSSARASSASKSRRRCARAASTSTSSRRNSVPLERVMGAELGRFVQALHEAHGVVFHLGQTVSVGRRAHGHAERRRRRSMPTSS